MSVINQVIPLLFIVLSTVHNVESLRRLVVVHDDRHNDGSQADCRDIIEVRDTEVLLKVHQTEFARSGEPALT
jgi:hypothetical protein